MGSSDEEEVFVEYGIEVKIMGDSYPDGFSNGMTMSEGPSTRDFKEIGREEEVICYENSSHHRINLFRRKKGMAEEIWTEFIASKEQGAVLEMLSSFALKGICADKIHRLQSFWSAEGKLRTETVDELHLEPSWNRCGMRIEKFGNVGSMPVRKYFPFVVLEDGKNGRYLGVQLYCPSSWQMELLCREDENLIVTGGIADSDFGHWTKKLEPGESFCTPKAVVAQGNTLYEVCDKLVKAQQPDISPADGKMGIVFNEYCTTWGNPDYNKIRRICDRLKEKKIRYFVIDSGWYGHGDEWWSSIGDWDVNEDRFPGGLKPVADYIRSCGMIPGLWFEFECLSEKSVHYHDREHLLKRNGIPLTVGGRRFWDMEDPWVIEYLNRKVIGLLKECGFGYLKVDYNETIGMGCDGEGGSLGENLRRKVLASQDFFRRIKREIPDIVIENCSSGGHRLEPSMMELVSQASFSDAHETRAIPLIAANMHRVIRPSQSQIWAVLRREDDENRIFYSVVSTFLGRMCLSGDVDNLSEQQWKLVEEGMDFYREVSDIIRDGVTTLCTYDTTQYNQPTGSQLVIRRLKGRCLAVFHRFEHSREADLSFLEGCRILKEYGSAGEDFSAKAWLYEEALEK